MIDLPETDDVVPPCILAWCELLRGPSLGYITAAHDIRSMAREYGDCAVVIKDVRGARHVVPATSLARLSARAAEAISMVFVASRKVPRSSISDVRTELEGIRRELVECLDRPIGSPDQAPLSGSPRREDLARIVGRIAWLEEKLDAVVEERETCFEPTHTSATFLVDSAGEPPLPAELDELKFRSR